MNQLKPLLIFLLFFSLSVSLHTQTLEWDGYWAGGYISGTPNDPWIIIQPTSSFSFQILDADYQTVDNFTLPIPGGNQYYSVVAAAPDFDTDGNIEVLYQYMDETYYKYHVYLRDIATSSNQLVFSDTDTSYYAYTFYFGNERTIIITGTYDTGTHAWIYRSNNPQAIDDSRINERYLKPFLLLSPNPVHKKTEIKYNVPKDGNVEICIYNISGNRIKTLSNGKKKAGKHNIIWDGTDFRNMSCPSGNYICFVNVNGETISRKMVLLK
jgi:hypothetical protein